MHRRIVNANKFGFGPLRAEAEAAAVRECRAYETTCANPDGWRAVETSAPSGQNNFPALVFEGEQSPEIEAVLRRCC